MGHHVGHLAKEHNSGPSWKALWSWSTSSFPLLQDVLLSYNVVEPHLCSISSSCRRLSLFLVRVHSRTSLASVQLLLNTRLSVLSSLVEFTCDRTFRQIQPGKMRFRKLVFQERIRSLSTWAWLRRWVIMLVVKMANSYLLMWDYAWYLRVWAIIGQGYHCGPSWVTKQMVMGHSIMWAWS